MNLFKTVKGVEDFSSMMSIPKRAALSAEMTSSTTLIVGMPGSASNGIMTVPSDWNTDLAKRNLLFEGRG